MEYEFNIEDAVYTLDLAKKGEQYIVTDGEESYGVDIRYISPHVISIMLGERTYTVYVARDGDKRYISLNGQQFCVTEPSDSESEFSGSAGQSQEDMLKIRAPMPGKVIQISVKEGEIVRPKQTLAIVEAMKMENEIKTGIDAVVKKIFVEQGELVDSDKVLIELEEKG